MFDSVVNVLLGDAIQVMSGVIIRDGNRLRATLESTINSTPCITLGDKLRHGYSQTALVELNAGRLSLDQAIRLETGGPLGPIAIDEIIVEGVFVLPEGPIVQIQSLGQETSYLLRPGDQLWDGDVVSISFEEVIFKQSVNDPTALKPFREVVKRLEP